MDSLTEKRLNRINKSKLNAITTLWTSMFMGVASFVERTVFNHCFITDYLGLYSFYQSVLGMISVIELGIGAAITYALYAPIEYKEYDQIAAIMRLFKHVYWLIGTIIFIVGLSIMPFLGNFVHTEIPIANVRLYFLFFLMKTVTGYFLTYKSILINANQNQYKYSLVTNITWCFLYIAEIIISLTTRSFLYYCIAIFSADFIRASIIYFLGGREFPELKKHKKAKLKPGTHKVIIKNVSGLIFTRIGSSLVSTTDSVLISMMVSTAFLGRYSNYQMLTSGIKRITNLIPHSIIASVGNAGVSETRRSLSKSFMTLDLASYFVYGLIAIVILNIATPIVSTFFGADRVIGTSSVVLLCISFYLSCQREMLLTFKSSLGLYWADRKRPFIEGLVNLITSVIFGYFLGFNGIIIGTIISQVCVNLMIEPRVIFHSGLYTSSFGYYLNVILRFLLSSFIAAICLIVNHFIPVHGVLEVIIKTITTSAITLGIFFIAYRHSEDAAFIFRTFKVAFFKKKKTS